MASPTLRLRAHGRPERRVHVTFPSIPRRLAALAAMSALALALSAAPALAGSQANGHSGWFVYGGGPQPVTGLQETCGDSLYTVVSGTIDSVWQMKGSIDPNTGCLLYTSPSPRD